MRPNTKSLSSCQPFSDATVPQANMAEKLDWYFYSTHHKKPESCRRQMGGNKSSSEPPAFSPSYGAATPILTSLVFPQARSIHIICDL